MGGGGEEGKRGYLAPEGGKEKDLAFIDGNQTGLDEADMRLFIENVDSK